MIKIVIGTSNPHKLSEINSINTYKNIIFDTIKNQNFNPDENGKTFAENAIIKAKEGAKLCGEYCLADDSGLCVECLGGLPGILSARYEETREKRINKLLCEMAKTNNAERRAYFLCSMALASPQGEILYTTEGQVNGVIIKEIKGLNGFGYDPVFYIPQYNQTMAQMSEDLKNKISHRANALMPMLKWINDNLI